MCADERLWGVNLEYREGCPNRPNRLVWRCSGFAYYYDDHDEFGIEYARGWDESFRDNCEEPMSAEEKLACAASSLSVDDCVNNCPDVTRG